MLAYHIALCALFCGRTAGMEPWKTEPFLDENGSPLAGSISEKVFVNINGVEQGMFIKSKDATHPVLLYLHGGMPDYFLTQKYPTGLENDFTVVWWEQRGSGISYRADIPPETMTLDQLISDTTGGDELLAPPVRSRKDIPDGTFGGNLYRHPGGGTGAGIVLRLHWRGSDV